VSDVLAETSAADAAMAQWAIDAAREALPVWSQTTPWERSVVLDRAGSEVMARADELGDLLAREEGKTLPEARGEVIRAGQILKYFAGAVLQPHGLALDSVRPGIEITVTREPVGVVSVITPWNFPFNVVLRKMTPVIASGNTCILKPASLTPRTGACIVELFDEAGFAPMESYPPAFIRFNLRAKRLGVPPGGLTQDRLSRNAPDAQEAVADHVDVEDGRGFGVQGGCEGRGAVTAVFISPHFIACPDQRRHEIVITKGVLTQTVGNLHDCGRLLLRRPAVIVNRDSEGVDEDIVRAGG